MEGEGGVALECGGRMEVERRGVGGGEGGRGEVGGEGGGGGMGGGKGGGEGGGENGREGGMMGGREVSERLNVQFHPPVVGSCNPEQR